MTAPDEPERVACDVCGAERTVAPSERDVGTLPCTVCGRVQPFHPVRDHPSGGAPRRTPPQSLPDDG